MSSMSSTLSRGHDAAKVRAIDQLARRGVGNRLRDQRWVDAIIDCVA